MSYGRPYLATITVRCATPGCTCERTMPAKVYISRDDTELVDRPYEKTCQTCGHPPMRHATLAVQRGAAVERRTHPR